MSQTTTPTTDAYVPGVCNINTAEIAKRRLIGYVGGAVFIALLVLFLALPFTRWIRVVLILPAILSVSGFMQAKNHFCVGYAGAGQQNATEGSDAATNVIIEEAIAKDKARAKQMNRQTLVIGVVIGLVTLLIPVFNK